MLENTKSHQNLDKLWKDKWFFECSLQHWLERLRTCIIESSKLIFISFVQSIFNLTIWPISKSARIDGSPHFLFRNPPVFVQIRGFKRPFQFSFDFLQFFFEIGNNIFTEFCTEQKINLNFRAKNNIKSNSSFSVFGYFSGETKWSKIAPLDSNVKFWRENSNTFFHFQLLLKLHNFNWVSNEF